MDFLAAASNALGVHFRRYFLEWIIGVIAVTAVASALWLMIAPPAGFPRGITIAITQGESAPKVAQELSADGLIAHPGLFALLLRVSGEGGSIKAGPYRFATPTDLLTLIWRLTRGYSGIPDIRITFIEGESVRQMSLQISRAFPDISASDYIAAAGPYEGYLFPDTYRFPASANAATIVASQQKDFATKIASIQKLITNSPHALSDIVIMASIVQAEAADPTDQKMVAGILWNRIARGMPLQVDATFGYLADRAEYAPKLSDLSIDSPYNTYKYKGLPPTPIGNPGLSALTAAVASATTSDLYYLTGKDGLMHYAATYAGQLANEQKYLK